ncbi:hypothetical protein [Kitasatospora sp. NPDC005856]|uniref:hypothetical protein n=1 Tax=Kitasatospora sp. NPDC005856 TaxID=3154566 RepID=UPI0033CCF684
MARTKPLVLTALTAVTVLAASAAVAFADDKPAVKPSVVVAHDEAVADPSMLAAHTPVFGDPVDVPAGGHGLATATCPSGQVPTGGGGQTSAFDIFFTDSYPSGSSWVIRGTNTGTVNQSISANAVCTTP